MCCRRLVPTLLWADLGNAFVLLAMFALLAFAAIGFIDDYAKVSKQQNLGLTSAKKFSLQLLVSLVCGIGCCAGYRAVRVLDAAERSVLEAAASGSGGACVYVFEAFVVLAFLPFLFFVAIVVAGASNAVNLTDGLDGLAIGCTVIAAGALTVLTYVSSNFRWANYLEIGTSRAWGN